MRNPWIHVLVIVTIGVGATISTVGMVVLSMKGMEVPQALVMTAGTCYGALGAFLVPSGVKYPE